MTGLALSVLADALWKSSLILSVAGLASLALHRLPASYRHLVWVSALAGALALPFCTLVVPRWNVPVWADLVPAQGAALFRVDAVLNTQQVAPSTPLQPRPAGKNTTQASRPPLGMLWLAGLALVALRIGLGFVATARLRRQKEPARPQVASLARELVAAMRLHQTVRVFEISSETTPMTWGVLRPVIVIPASTAVGDPQRLRTILLHELAHVGRYDYLLQMLGQAACALYWYNPLVWLAQRQALRLRERACDDFVIRSGVQAPDYASHLVQIARSMRVPRLCASLAMARCSNLESRIRSVLDPRLRRTGLTPAKVAIVASVAAILTLGLSAVRPASAEVPAPTGSNLATVERNAAVQVAAFEFDKAVDLYREALQIRKDTFGGSSVEYAEGLQRLGALYRAWDQFSDALPCYTEALSILQRSLGQSHPALFEALYFLALDAHSRQDEAAAEAFYQRAFDVRKQIGGGETALALLGLASIAEHRGDRAKAEQLLSQALSFAPEVSLESSAVLTKRSLLLRELGRREEANAALVLAVTVEKQWAQAVAAVRQAAPRPSTSAPAPYRVGAGVAAPLLISKTEPQYSREARLVNLEGAVVLTVVIGADGLVHDVRFTQPLGFGLDEQAIKAVRQWRFQPGSKNGEPVPVQAQIEVNFRLM